MNTEPLVHKSLLFAGVGPKNRSFLSDSKRRRRPPVYLHEEQSSEVTKDNSTTGIVSQK